MKIIIISTLTKNLLFRETADKIFDEIIEKSSDNLVCIDFKNTESITRSFAHQYMIRKNHSKKQIKEINIPTNILKMIEIFNNLKKNTIEMKY
jgi:hypothetical protein